MKSLTTLFSRGIFAACVASAFSAMAGTLPEKYVQLDYIDTGDGGAYFNTGVCGQYETVVDAKIYFNSVGDYQCVLGSTETSGANLGRMEPIWFNHSQPLISSRYMYYAVNEEGKNIILQPETEYVIQASTGTQGNFDSIYLKIDGEKQLLSQDSKSTDFTDYDGENNTIGMTVGINNQGGRLVDPFKGRIYYLKITVQDELVRDYVACSNTVTGIVGMYDLTGKSGEGDENFKPSSSAVPFKGPATQEEPIIEDAIAIAIANGAGIIGLPAGTLLDDVIVAQDGSSFSLGDKSWNTKNEHYEFVKGINGLEQKIKASESFITSFEQTETGYVIGRVSVTGFSYSVCYADNIDFDGAQTTAQISGNDEEISIPVEFEGPKCFYKLIVVDK